MRLIRTSAFAAGCVLALGAGAALAAGSHSGGHGHDNSDGHHDAMMSVGKPGKAADVSRTIEVTMKESDDGRMLFEPSRLEFKTGETIRFAIANAGEIDHEFVLDDQKGVMEHKELMERFPDMEHDDPNSVRLAPGETGEIIWTFANGGSFEFACLIPGHYDSGMRGDLVVGGR
ncbi:cupredoxin family protein [Stappia sp. WLB 29]|uniref:cupredoxin domain-containing protein n=1 Tax=Stappia sp. WLB 29 TaxID=2925220 RepID=UPI0020BEA237|nr:cupredoxin family protein [Stappia sp. WLB 29]